MTVIHGQDMSDEYFSKTEDLQDVNCVQSH